MVKEINSGGSGEAGYSQEKIEKRLKLAGEVQATLRAINTESKPLEGDDFAVFAKSRLGQFEIDEVVKDIDFKIEQLKKEKTRKSSLSGEQEDERITTIDKEIERHKQLLDIFMTEKVSSVETEQDLCGLINGRTYRNETMQTSDGRKMLIQSEGELVNMVIKGLIDVSLVTKLWGIQDKLREFLDRK